MTSHNSREYFREWLRELLRSGKSHSLPLPIVTPLGVYRSIPFDSKSRFFSRQKRIFLSWTLWSSLTPWIHVGRCGQGSVAGEHAGPDGNGISRGGPSWDADNEQDDVEIDSDYIYTCINMYMTYYIYMTYVYMCTINIYTQVTWSLFKCHICIPYCWLSPSRTLFCERIKWFSISKYRGRGQGHNNLKCPSKKHLFLGDLNT